MTNYQIESREWWVERWIELLDSYRFKKRLERARLYAREGNVFSIDFQGSQVLAKVQGTDPEPYQVSLSLDPFQDQDWNYVIETMGEKAIFSAQLLAGEMPKNIEEVFTANGLSLFPFTLNDIHSRCTCPDKANPCKHIGAVYYQLADRFSEDPFVLFQLRGRTKEQILHALRQLRSRRVQERVNSKEEKKNKITKKLSSNQSSFTPLSVERYWQYNEPIESSLVIISPPQDGKTVLDLLGNIPLPYTDAQLIRQCLETIYQTASQQAIISALNRD